MVEVACKCKELEPINQTYIACHAWNICVRVCVCVFVSVRVCVRENEVGRCAHIGLLYIHRCACVNVYEKNCVYLCVINVAYRVCTQV